VIFHVLCGQKICNKRCCLRVQRGYSIRLSDYEVYKKIKNAEGEQSAMEAFAQIGRTRIVDLTAQISIEAAESSLSTSLGMVDSIIVATAKAYNAQKITSDMYLKNLKEVIFIENESF
jgi:toxin FitB